MSSHCRFCNTELEHVFCDLGMSPLSNAFVSEDQLNSAESFYPLRAYVCGKCFLVQLEEFESPAEIFSDYVYFSSVSDSWLDHARRYADEMCDRLGLNAQSTVVEIASNDGYLLQYFAAAGIPVLGVEPAANVAKVAEEKGINTLVEFFGEQTARTIASSVGKADLLLGNNVLAHVPDLNDFVAGLKLMLKPDGVVTMEFPHLLELMQQGQFDTIYHEHFSYLSLLAVHKVFEHHRLSVFDAEKLGTHGGSLRIFATHSERQLGKSERLNEIDAAEQDFGLADLTTYGQFAALPPKVKRNLLAFLIEARRDGLTVAAYGAAAKGNTLLNYCGIREDMVEYVADRSPAKQGLYLPGTHIPVFAPEKIRRTRPDYVLILPWNIRDEIIEKIAFVRDWGGKFVVPIPTLSIVE